MIDLNTCNPCDTLLTSQGSILEYLGKTPMLGVNYLDHVIRYVTTKEGKPYETSAPNGCLGSRTNDGFVFAKNRIPETDHVVIEIIKKDSDDNLCGMCGGDAFVCDGC